MMPGPEGERLTAAPGAGPGTRSRRLLVVSHPSVIAVNQAVYLSMMELGWAPQIVVPDRWRHDYSTDTFAAEALPGLEDRLLRLRVLLPGRPQRHLYLARPQRIIEHFAPEAVFLEQESFSCAAMQWGLAAHRAGLPFGVQSDENLDRRLPLPARAIRRWVLDRAAFVAARSPTAATRAAEWGAKGRVEVVPHAVPLWDPVPRNRDGAFTIGFAGRLVPEKGIADLVGAARLLDGPVRLLFVGEGPMRSELEAVQLPEGTIEVRTGIHHRRMPDAYADMDVLVLPSRTTPTWAEQFGRVLVEALSCGVPVVGSDSGEIPWVVTTTGGGHIFPEGDVEQLARVLHDLRANPPERARLARQGKAMVEKTFTADACARAMTDLLRP
jgi:glycosyltransferase involved in cell wall biosynthesis